MQAMLMLGGALVVYGVYSCVSGLLHNIAEAKRSGFNYVVCRAPAPPPTTRTERLGLTANSLQPRVAAVADHAGPVGAPHSMPAGKLVGGVASVRLAPFSHDLVLHAMVVIEDQRG